MRANRRFRLIASRDWLQPVFLADPDRLDRIEIVSVEDGEVVLFWHLPAKDASRLVKALRTDLAGMDADEFLRTWEGADAATDSS